MRCKTYEIGQNRSIRTLPPTPIIEVLDDEPSKEGRTIK